MKELFGLGFFTLSMIAMLYLIIALPNMFTPNIQQSKTDQLIDLARKSGMLRYKLAVKQLNPDVDTDRLDSVYNTDINKYN